MDTRLRYNYSRIKGNFWSGGERIGVKAFTSSRNARREEKYTGMGIRLVPLTRNRERRGPLISADKKGFGLDTLVEEFFFPLSFRWRFRGILDFRKKLPAEINGTRWSFSRRISTAIFPLYFLIHVSTTFCATKVICRKFYRTLLNIFEVGRTLIYNLSSSKYIYICISRIH